MQTTRRTLDYDDLLEELVLQHVNGRSTDDDVLLAAEVGKALLDRNGQLQQENERLTAEYSLALERLQQDNHTLRRKVDSVSGDYDARLAELQSDLASAQQELRWRQQAARCTEEERKSLVNELSEQNQRLADQLSKATSAEDQLANQLSQLRDRFNLRRSTVSGHVLQLEVLQEEFALIAGKKADLERTIQSLAEERESISLSLEESADRIVLLEKHAAHQELKIRGQEHDLEEMRHMNCHLLERLEALSRHGAPPQTSLLAEIEMSDEDNATPLVGILQPPPPDDRLAELMAEVVDAHSQIRNLCLQVRRPRGGSVSSSSSDDVSPGDIRPGLLSDALGQLRALLHDVLRREAKGASCGACGRSEREDVERDLSFVREELSRTQKKLAQKTEDGRRKSDEILNLNSKLNIQQIELQHLSDERLLLRENLRDGHLAQDEVVGKAWEARDRAIARKNAVEIELAKTRIDVMNINSQLLEAIQQKLELSQQLDQWQVDMQALLEDQMQRRLIQEEQCASEDSDYASGHNQAAAAASLSSTSRSKLFALWR